MPYLIVCHPGRISTWCEQPFLNKIEDYTQCSNVYASAAPELAVKYCCILFSLLSPINY